MPLTEDALNIGKGVVTGMKKYQVVIEQVGCLVKEEVVAVIHRFDNKFGALFTELLGNYARTAGKEFCRV